LPRLDRFVLAMQGHRLDDQVRFHDLHWRVGSSGDSATTRPAKGQRFIELPRPIGEKAADELKPEGIRPRVTAGE
jgi:hypothetical protein